MTTVERRAGPWTRTERNALPDDGRRHELLDGVLHVSPAPGPPHQFAVGNLYALLREHCPPTLRVAIAPLDVVLAEDTVVEPDLLVAPLAEFTDLNLPVPPLLAVEVLAPSNHGYDLVDKRERYERAGVPSYWVIDPRTATLTVWELRDGAYVEIAGVRGTEPFTAEAPFPVTVVPAEITKP